MNASTDAVTAALASQPARITNDRTDGEVTISNTVRLITSNGASPFAGGPEAAPGSVESIYAGHLAPEDRDRVLKALANAQGVRLPNTRVPEGESLLPIGEDAKRGLQAEVAALPDLADGLAALRARILAESHKDSKVAIQQVRMDSDRGGLYGLKHDPSKSLAYTEAGFGHVVSYVNGGRVRQGLGASLLALPPRIRADAFNWLAESARRADGEPVVIRTAVDPRSGRRVVRAVTSARHSLEAGDDLATIRALEAACPAGGKVRVTRDSDRTDIEILFPGLQREVKVGDAVLFKVHIANSETKAGALHVWGGLLRVLCYNFTTAWAGIDEEISLRHVGNIGPRIGAAVRRALATIDPFVKAFGDAYATPLPSFAPTRGEVLERIGKRFELGAGTLDLAGQLWDRDGARSAGDTLAGLSNALTRASQELTLQGAQAVEQVAGRIVVEGWEALN